LFNRQLLASYLYAFAQSKARRRIMEWRTDGMTSTNKPAYAAPIEIPMPAFIRYSEIIFVIARYLSEEAKRLQ
jgi:hypothetical protein